MSDMSNAYKYLIESSVKFAHLEPIKYLFLKVNATERESLVKVLNDAIGDRYYDCMGYYDREGRKLKLICFLLSHLNEDQETKFIQENRGKDNLLSAFLKWPWQPLFVELAKRIKNVCDFFDTDEGSIVMYRIGWRVEDGYKDYDYPALFEEFWQLFSTSLKNNVSLMNIYSEICANQGWQINFHPSKKVKKH